jgi:hypothetical protein
MLHGEPPPAGDVEPMIELERAFTTEDTEGTEEKTENKTVLKTRADLVVSLERYSSLPYFSVPSVVSVVNRLFTPSPVRA